MFGQEIPRTLAYGLLIFFTVMGLAVLSIVYQILGRKSGGFGAIGNIMRSGKVADNYAQLGKIQVPEKTRLIYACLTGLSAYQSVTMTWNGSLILSIATRTLRSLRECALRKS
ncbi:hypothetical protein [Robiginitomaculum antarcticum]|uniref:hypothetical protein n=1 Tax=Robiginitomaculum antarcticum TaxID=437507 RepID=UPI0012E9C9AD|nr:hypothetical protein [Robiginitomaculum antarcticum]